MIWSGGFRKFSAINSPEKMFKMVIDVISAIEFNKNGDHMAVGDRGSRLVIFQSDCCWD
ncbi:hypothetical protein CASFOL_027902 [Castilleja foliolosa]|uniref:Uncharacterized protein n=1 Tax=Castilleja foliolosa TaxID=1961234 RepID=A0ABD3CIS9_9LAMI